MVDSEFCFIGLNQTLLSAEINGSIVGLLAAFIDDGNFDALISFTPNMQRSPHSRWHSSTKKTTNCPETIWARWASNQSVISCLFFDQFWVFFWDYVSVFFPANPSFFKQAVVALLRVKHYIVLLLHIPLQFGEVPVVLVWSQVMTACRCCASR